MSNVSSQSPQEDGLNARAGCQPVVDEMNAAFIMSGHSCKVIPSTPGVAC
jgi:hypothetical protein